jgi:G-protein coupled receptor 98
MGVPIGESLAAITIRILPDQFSEMDETMTITLQDAQPLETQRLRVGYESINVVILENDNPGGVFQISQSTPAFFNVEVLRRHNAP